MVVLVLAHQVVTDNQGKVWLIRVRERVRLPIVSEGK